MRETNLESEGNSLEENQKEWEKILGKKIHDPFLAPEITLPTNVSVFSTPFQHAYSP